MEASAYKILGVPSTHWSEAGRCLSLPEVGDSQIRVGKLPITKDLHDKNVLTIAVEFVLVSRVAPSSLMMIGDIIIGYIDDIPGERYCVRKMSNWTAGRRSSLERWNISTDSDRRIDFFSLNFFKFQIEASSLDTHFKKPLRSQMILNFEICFVQFSRLIFFSLKWSILHSFLKQTREHNQTIIIILTFMITIFNLLFSFVQNLPCHFIFHKCEFICDCIFS